MFDLTEFLYKGRYITDLDVLEYIIHSDNRGYFVKSESNIDGIDCILFSIHHTNLIMFSRFTMEPHSLQTGSLIMNPLIMRVLLL